MHMLQFYFFGLECALKMYHPTVVRHEMEQNRLKESSKTTIFKSTLGFQGLSRYLSILHRSNDALARSFR